MGKTNGSSDHLAKRLGIMPNRMSLGPGVLPNVGWSGRPPVRAQLQPVHAGGEERRPADELRRRAEGPQDVSGAQRLGAAPQSAQAALLNALGRDHPDGTFAIFWVGFIGRLPIPQSVNKIKARDILSIL